MPSSWVRVVKREDWLRLADANHLVFALHEIEGVFSAPRPDFDDFLFGMDRDLGYG